MHPHRSGSPRLRAKGSPRYLDTGSLPVFGRLHHAARSLSSRTFPPLAALLLGCTGVSPAAQPAPPRPLDELLEQTDQWKIDHPERVTVLVDSQETHDTPQALHLRWRKDLGKLDGAGTHRMPQVPSCWLRLPDDIDLTLYTRLVFHVRIRGTDHGHLHVSFSNQPRLWGEGVVKRSSNEPLDAGDWSAYTVTLADLEETDTRAFRWLGISSVNVGHQPHEAPVMDVWLDDVNLTAEPLRQTEGWNADPTVIIVNHAGFRRHHEKHAVLNGENPGAEFVVRRQPDGEEAFRGRWRKVASAAGTYKVADFTALTDPGAYTVETGELSSSRFSVGDDAYDACIELLSDWVFNMRCGRRTGLHGPCHTDDGTLVLYEGDGDQRKEVSRKHVDVVGGWHDAGDIRTYYSYTFWMSHQSLRARECGWMRDRDDDGVDDFLDSALWGVKHLPKIRHPSDGRFFFKIADWPDYRRGNYWTDAVVGTDDDRHLMDFRSEGGNVDSTGRACASAGLFARVGRDRYPEVARRALEAAEARWRTWFDPAEGRKKWREGPLHVHRHGYHIAKWGQGGLQLHLATGAPVYLDFARVCAEHVLGYQRRTFFAGNPRPLCGEIFSWLRTLPDRDLPEEYIADLMLELPDDADYCRWRAALVRVANWWMKPTRHFWRPFSVPHLEVPKQSFEDGWFGVPIEMSPDAGVVRYLVPTAGTLQLGDTAQGLQRVAQALNDPELERAARRQVQWAIGHNPFNVSWVCRFGSDSIDQFYSFSQGRMPGCVSSFGIGNDGIPKCRRPNGGEPITTSGARLLRAMVAVTQPARLRLTVKNGATPWTEPVEIRWPRGGQTVFSGKPAGDGTVPGVSLDGGQDYELVCGRTVIPLPAISGTTYERTVDLSRVLVLAADTPRYVLPGQPFTVQLRAENRGTGPLSTTISVHTEDATTGTAERSVTVAAGETTAVPWTFTAGEANRPYVLIFQPDADRHATLDVTGPILP